MTIHIHYHSISSLKKDGKRKANSFIEEEEDDDDSDSGDNTENLVFVVVGDVTVYCCHYSTCPPQSYYISPLRHNSSVIVSRLQ